MKSNIKGCDRIRSRLGLILLGARTKGTFLYVDKRPFAGISCLVDMDPCDGHTAPSKPTVLQPPSLPADKRALIWLSSSPVRLTQTEWFGCLPVAWYILQTVLLGIHVRLHDPAACMF